MAMTPYYTQVPAGYPMAMQQHMMMAAPMMMPHQLQATPYYAPVALPSPSVTLHHKERAFTIHNIANESLLKLDMDGLKHQVMRDASKPGQLRVEYSPKGDEHHVNAKYNGADIPGLAFTLKPRPVEVTNHPEKKMFTIKNVHAPDTLGVNSRTLKYQIVQDKLEPTTYHALYQPENGVHDVAIEYKGKLAPNGNFRLAPRNLPQQPQQQMMMVPMMHPHMMMQPTAGHMAPAAPMQIQGTMPATQQPQQLMMPFQPQFMTPMQQQPQQQQYAAPTSFQPIMGNGPPTFMTPIQG